MKNYVIFTDSTADLPEDVLTEMDIKVVPMKLVIDGKTYREDEIDSSKFYEIIRTSDRLPTTTQVNPQEYSECFEEFLKRDVSVLYVCFSSALSGCYNSACIAANDLNARYESKVKVVDSLSASMGEGMLVYKLAMQKKNGLDFQQAIEWSESNRLKICHLFTVDDLNHLSRSGRLSKTSAFFGSMLNIKPVLHVDDEGRLVTIDKARGRHKALDSIVDKMKLYTKNTKNDFVFISHGDCFDDANELAEKIKDKLGINNIIIGNITPMIGTHTGLGTLAVFFEANKR